MSETLAHVASYVRSKNAGPFWLTIDIFCPDTDSYDRVVRSPVADRGVVAGVYHADPSTVEVFAVPDLLALKLSLPRPTVQGALGDRDAHAGQQYVPLLDLAVP